MSQIHYFSEQPKASEIPVRCRDPFENNPHPLAIRASKDLQQRLINSVKLPVNFFDKDNGKMFGVLVVSDDAGRIGYLSSFSGMLNKQWITPNFVPPVFNIQQQQEFLDNGETQVTKLTQQIELLLNSTDRLQAMVRMKEFEFQKENDLAGLKKQHKKNKQQRRKKRSEVNNDEALQVLSFLSQQDKRKLKQCKSAWDKKLVKARQQFTDSYEIAIDSLKQKRKQLSRQLHRKVFENYRLVNKLGEQEPMLNLFDGKLPAGGTGDCAVPKLLQFAHQNKYKILAMAEFWWGAPPDDGVRHHAHFYPPCRGKCHPILPFMLKGIEIEQTKKVNAAKKLEPVVVYEDDSLVVVNKPAGLLSIPGKQQECSVLDWLQQRYPQATGALLVHRLDMATSGLLLAAKNSQAHKHLQKQFINRGVQKRYVAVLSKVIQKQNVTVNLPLRVDLDDRPRQLVCYEHGKEAVTHVKVISTDENSTRVYFYPVTGRTHQLRVHAAHNKGLGAAIIGDELYGTRSERLLLHAEKLSFDHPLTGERLEVKVDVPF